MFEMYESILMIVWVCSIPVSFLLYLMIHKAHFGYAVKKGSEMLFLLFFFTALGPFGLIGPILGVVDIGLKRRARRRAARRIDLDYNPYAMASYSNDK